MAKKKGIRESRHEYIKRDLRELKKLGFEEIDVLNGRSIESLAYTKKGYDNYRKHIRALKSNYRKSNNINDYGVVYTNKQMKQIQNLEKKSADIFKKKLNNITNNRNLSEIEKEFLNGKPIYHSKSAIEINVSIPLKGEKYKNIVQNKNDLKHFNLRIKEANEYLDQLEKMDTDKMLGLNTEGFKKNFLKVFETDLEEWQVEELKNDFENLNYVERASILQNMDRLISWVNSLTGQHGAYAGEPYMAIKEKVLTFKTGQFNIIKRG